MSQSDADLHGMATPHRLRDWLEGRKTSPLGRAARLALRPLGWLYGAGMHLRGALYQRNVLHAYRPPVPVISVGNLTVGGTGKTPFTLRLVEMLLGLSRHPAILLRGYGADNPDEADEAQLYRQRVPDVPVFAGRDRVASARKAVAEGADVLLLDDGFQHLRLVRDLDIVLLDARCPLGGGHPMPAGLLREYAGALRRADLLCLTHADHVADPEAIIAMLSGLHPGVPVLRARHSPSRLISPDGTPTSLSALAGRSVVALCGIARPDGFMQTLAALGANVIHMRSYPDHHPYGAGELAALKELADAHNADLITTEKDAVKLHAGAVWVVGVDLSIEDEKPLRKALVRVIDTSPLDDARPD